ncbi:MAG: hypothetical protein A2Z34_03370 [Planctomycetes bacterium RBG_16_59_8]|nr:MAG: hypothetical protein A2Z34_03370 [Planctomycetes bacterium RBG_16_59_8]
MQLDLHVHTRYSFDCAMDPEKLIRIARKRGLDGIAITDHNAIEGARETARIAPDGFTVIIGEEVSTTSGDILGLFLREEIVTDDPIEAVDAIKAQGGVAILPHPFARSVAIDEKVARKLDACEGFNARYSRSRAIENNVGDELVVAFARQYDLTLVASSDAHFYREIGRARTIVPASNPDEIKDALLRGNTVLHGMRSSPLNRVASAVLKIARKMFNPVPEELARRSKPGASK